MFSKIVYFFFCQFCRGENEGIVHTSGFHVYGHLMDAFFHGMMELTLQNYIIIPNNKLDGQKNV